MKTNKIILSLIFVFIFIFSAFTFTACRVEGGGSIFGQTQTGGNGGSPNDNDNTQLSEFTKTFLISSKYQALVDKFIENYYDSTVETHPIPFRFLREHGFDVDAYLNGELKIISTPFMYEDEPNNLYVSVKAECPSNDYHGNYYHNYILKYSVSDKERKEYIYLCDNKYIEGLLFIQALDDARTPTIVSDKKIAVKAYENIIDYDNKTNFKNYDSVDVDIISTSVDNSQLVYIWRRLSASMYATTIIAKNDIKLDIDAFDCYYDNNVYYVENPEYGKYLNDYKHDYRDGYTFGAPLRVNRVHPYEEYINYNKL